MMYSGCLYLSLMKTIASYTCTSVSNKDTSKLNYQFATKYAWDYSTTFCFSVKYVIGKVSYNYFKNGLLNSI